MGLKTILMVDEEQLMVLSPVPKPKPKLKFPPVPREWIVVFLDNQPSMVRGESHTYCVLMERATGEPRFFGVSNRNRVDQVPIEREGRYYSLQRALGAMRGLPPRPGSMSLPLRYGTWQWALGITEATEPSDAREMARDMIDAFKIAQAYRAANPPPPRKPRGTVIAVEVSPPEGVRSTLADENDEPF